MKKINIVLALMIFFMGLQQQVFAQTLACNAFLEASLDINGEAVIYPEFILEGEPVDDAVISRDGENFGPFVTFDCSDIGDSIVVEVMNPENSNSCWGYVMVSDMNKPVPYCISLSTAVVGSGNNYVELYAKDFSIGSFDNCSIASYTYESYAFAFAEEVIDGVLVSKSIDHYFDESGPLAASSNANASVVSDYEAGNIQLWHAAEMSSSRRYLTDSPSLLLEVEMTVTDVAGNSDYCVVSLTISNPNSAYIPGSCTGETVQSGIWNCGPETLFAEDYIDDSILAENATISYDNILYSATLPGASLTSGENTIFVRYEVDTELFTCTADIVVEDGVAPVVAARQDLTIVLADFAGVLTAFLTAEEVDAGSYDVCSDVSLQLSQTVFTVDDIGANTVTLTVIDASGNFNSTSTTVMVVGPEEVLGGSCLPDTTLLAAVFSCGPETIYAEAFIGEGVTFENATISYDGVNYSPSLSGDLLTSGVNEIHVRYNVGSDLYGCSSLLTIVDNIAPVAIGESAVTLQLQPGASGTFLPASQVDDGSYDHCSEVTFQLSQNIFTEDDLGENFVTLTVTDASGNSNAVISLVTVIEAPDCTGPVSALVTWPLEDIVVLDPVASPTVVSPTALNENFGFPLESVYPSFESGCEPVVAIAYEDLVFDVAGGWTINRTFTVLNWLNSSQATFTQTIQLVQGGTPFLVCAANTTVLVDENSLTLSAQDMVAQFNGDPNNLSLVITDQNGNVVLDNTFTTEHIGQTFTALVTDTSTGVFCSSTISVVGSSTCSAGPGISFNWAQTTLQISDPAAEADELSPEALISEYGFSEEQVMPTWESGCEFILASSYDDVVIDIVATSPGNHFRIIRNWAVINWITGDFYNHVQMIRNTVESDEYICDTLPRTAPLGDCESGHTDADDVEWPADLAVSDHRITPSQLVAINGVDPLDAEPSFYGQPDDYAATYVDILNTFTATTLTLDRTWSVVRNDGSELSWTYVQELSIDLSDFTNLVTTTTMTGRALPDVNVNGGLMTDDKGSVIVINGDVTSISRQDAFEDGVDLRDLILIREHILGITEFDALQLLAADTDGNDALTALDLVKIRNRLLGQLGDPIADWLFVKQSTTDGAPLPAGAYIGVKPADVDDSFTIDQGKTVEEGYLLQYADRLINKGETYEVAMDFSRDTYIRGTRLVFDIDSDVLSVTNVSHEFAGNIEWNIDENGQLIVVAEAEDELYQVGTGEQELLMITMEALENGILSEALLLSEEERSLFIDQNYDYNILEGEVTSVISSTFDDPDNALSFVSVYPNPAVNTVNFDFLKIDDQNVKIELLDISGRTIASQIGEGAFDISQFDSGVYLYKISDGQNVFLNRLVVLK